jgi:hypothetical protein
MVVVQQEVQAQEVVAFQESFQPLLLPILSSPLRGVEEVQDLMEMVLGVEVDTPLE